MNNKEMIEIKLGKTAGEVAQLIENHYDHLSENDFIKDYIQWARVSMQFHLEREELEKALYETTKCRDAILDYIMEV